MKRLLYTFICGSFIILWSCKKDFIVENIENKTLTVNAPANDLSTSVNLITFWWEPVEGAEKYNLQVVNPAFANVSRVILDTNISKTKFNVSLQPGIYQWRIKATNAGHSTAYQTYNLKIDTTSDLTNQFVNMLSPATGTLLGSKVVTFQWSTLNSAKKYRIQINNGLIADSLITKTSFTYTLPAASSNTTSFNWNVKAYNDQTETSFNTIANTFTVDLKAPSAPSLISPASGTTIRDTIRLVWNRNNAADVSHDSVYVATDSSFTNVISQTWTDRLNMKVIELTDPPNPNSTYYWWRVRSFDAVGNRSSFSGQLKFKLTP